MADYAPSEVARLLGITGETLRKWTIAFGGVLSSSARPIKPGQRRRYTDDDIAVLRVIHTHMDRRLGYAHVQRLLGIEQEAASSVSPESVPSVNTPTDTDQVLRQLVEVYEEHIRILQSRNRKLERCVKILAKW